MQIKPFASVLLGEQHPVTVLLPDPDPLPTSHLVGQEDLVARCQAAWFGHNADALHFRLVGPPGVGKNELVYELGRRRQQPLYIVQGHDELMPEDLACTARIADGQRVEYVGSPLLAAMLRGGICFFDEIGKAPSRALSLLASVLDNRRTLSSVLAGFTITAHPSFRFCAAMNDSDATTSGLPGFLDERLRPAFTIGYPTPLQAMTIAVGRTDVQDSELLNEFRGWVAAQKMLSPRRAIALLSYVVRVRRLETLEGTTTRPAATVIADACRAFGDEAA